MESLGWRMIFTMFLAVMLSLSLTSPVVGIDSRNYYPVDIGLLVNFSVPYDLNSSIAIPDQGGLLIPNLLAVGYQEYQYDGKAWKVVDQHAVLYNKTLSPVGSLFANSSFTPDAGTITFKFLDPDATVTATPIVSVPQALSISLQLLNTTVAVNTSTYSASDYVQRFGTIGGLPPDMNNSSVKGDTFHSSSPASPLSTPSTFLSIDPPSSLRGFPDVATSAFMGFNTDAVSLNFHDFLSRSNPVGHLPISLLPGGVGVCGEHLLKD